MNPYAAQIRFFSIAPDRIENSSMRLGWQRPLSLRTKAPSSRNERRGIAMPGLTAVLPCLCSCLLILWFALYFIPAAQSFARNLDAGSHGRWMNVQSGH